MTKQIITKTCSKCKQTKSLLGFHKNRSNKDGYNTQCKTCRKIYAKSPKGKIAIKCYQQGKEGRTAIRKANSRYRQSEKGKANQKICQKRYYIHCPKKLKARSAINNAVRDGKLPRPDTLQCHYGDHPAEQYHHYKGYEPEHWLDVISVCRLCDIKAHLIV